LYYVVVLRNTLYYVLCSIAMMSAFTKTLFVLLLLFHLYRSLDVK